MVLLFSRGKETREIWVHILRFARCTCGQENKRVLVYMCILFSSFFISSSLSLQLNPQLSGPLCLPFAFSSDVLLHSPVYLSVCLATPSWSFLGFAPYSTILLLVTRRFCTTLHIYIYIYVYVLSTVRFRWW